MSKQFCGCKSCVFLHVDMKDLELVTGQYPEFQCRKFAPRILHGVGEGWSDRMFPIVTSDTWCGEWQSDETRHE